MPVGDDELDELYKEVILDHYANPRNRRPLPNPTLVVEQNNPVCGDEIRLYVEISDDALTDVGFEGHGCSISQSSASMMTEMVKGESLDEVIGQVLAFKRLMTSNDAIDPDEWGDLEAFQGVRKFPVRVKCATLAWNALQESIEKYHSNRS